MIIKVTKDDIEKGRKDAANNCGCPIWHALTRELGVGRITMSYDEAFVGNAICFPLPEVAVKWQKHLVETQKARPFSFETNPTYRLKSEAFG